MKLLLFVVLITSSGFSQSDSNIHSLLKKNSFSSLEFNSEFKEIERADPFKKDLNYPVLIGLGSIYLGSGIAVHIYQQNAWWKDERQSFHFANDWNYALWIDKIGHMYGAIILQHAFSSALEAANVSIEKSAIYGSLAAFVYQMYVEIEDGFGPQWGFSPGDAIADVLGSGYPLLQYYYPYLKNFQFRFSYYPKDLNKTGIITGQKHIIIDDYEGQKFWLSVRMKEVLPKSVSKYWPNFLMLALGMGVKNLDGSGGGQRDFYLAFDFDFETIPLFGHAWQFVKNTLNYAHMPLPGIRITNGVTFFGLCF